MSILLVASLLLNINLISKQENPEYSDSLVMYKGEENMVIEIQLHKEKDENWNIDLLTFKSVTPFANGEVDFNYKNKIFIGGIRKASTNGTLKSSYMITKNEEIEASASFDLDQLKELLDTLSFEVKLMGNDREYTDELTLHSIQWKL